MFVDFCDHSSTEARWPRSNKLRWLMMTMMLIVCLAGSTSTKADDTDTDTAGKPRKTSRLDLTDDAADKDDEDDEETDEEDEDDNILGAQSAESLTTVSNGRFQIPSIAAVSTATGDIGNGSVPNGFRADSPRPVAPLPELANERRMIGQDSQSVHAGLDPSWNWSVTHWAAANTYSNPRYFEDVMLERHGHERWGHLQPLASGIRFFTTIPMLSYKMAIKPPCDCEYTMGYYRAGSCAPALYQRPPWDRKAILAESAAVASGMIIIP